MLVFLVMYLFLQNLRATLIPTIAVPVVLLGTFGVLAVLGYSINMLTMFAMVLAIGLLVDDAIVVVENVERLMSEEGLSPLEATRKSMDQITGALVGIGLVLAAVFVPMAFIAGSTGIIYRQFSATIVSAMALSVLVAIVLTPALCATILKPLKKGEHHGEKGFFRWFNSKFERNSARYRNGVRGMLDRSGRFMAIYVALLVVHGRAVHAPAQRVPAGRRPGQPDCAGHGAGRRHAGAHDAVDREGRAALPGRRKGRRSTSVFAVQGFSFGGGGQNTGVAFVNLKHWDERKVDDLHVEAVAGRGMGALMQIKDAMAFAFAPPPIPELGIATGFDFFLKDNGGPRPRRAGRRRATSSSGMAAQSKLLANVRPNGQDDTPQFHIDVDTQRAAALGLSIADINSTLSTAWGGQYIDDFVDRGRVKRVHMQADAPYRMSPDDFKLWSVRNKQGRDGALHRVRAVALGLRLAASRALQRRLGDRDPGRGGAGSQHGRGDGGSRATGRATAGGIRRRVDRRSRTRSGRRVRRRRCSTRCRCWSCSCASRRCTRAGPSRPPCCWSPRWASSAPRSPTRCAAWNATCTSRWRC